MLLKWITAGVPPEQRAAFSDGQAGWASLALAEGLIAQVGGWEGDRACVLAAWEDEEAYRRFFAHLHDPILERAKQAGTWRSLEVGLFSSILRMPGAAETLREAFATARLLRVADCRVLPGHEDHFVGAQLQIWAPGMERAEGMLGGRFSIAAEDPRRFLVTTLWATPSAHDHYAADRVGPMRDRSDAGADLAEVLGHRVVLEPAWRVIGG